MRTDLTPFRATIMQSCDIAPRTRQQLFSVCGGRKGIGRQRFEGLLAAMLKAGVLVRAGEIQNPLHGHGRNNNPVVQIYQGGARARRSLRPPKSCRRSQFVTLDQLREQSQSTKWLVKYVVPAE